MPQRISPAVFTIAAITIFACTSQSRADFIITFDEHPAITSFVAGDTFSSGGIDIIAMGGTGEFKIDNAPQLFAGGSGTEARMFLDRSMDLLLPHTMSLIEFRYADLDGTNFMTINGVTINDLMNSAGTYGPLGDTFTVSHVDTSPVPGGGDGRGIITITGDIASFAVGGQELAVDDVRLVPAPAAGALLLCGGLVGTCRKRRTN